MTEKFSHAYVHCEICMINVIGGESVCMMHLCSHVNSVSCVASFTTVSKLKDSKTSYIS